jgi:Tol biopolymer transport system component
VVVDGVEEQPVDQVFRGFPLFSPDSKRLAYAAKRGERVFVVVKDVAGTTERPEDHAGLFDRLEARNFVFSPNSQRYAFAAQKDDHDVVVVDDVRVGSFDWAARPVFSPDSASILYQVEIGGKASLRMRKSQSETQVGREYQIFGPATFSPDGRRIAYWANRSRKWRLVVANSEGATVSTQAAYDDFCDGTLVFSRGGRRMAYVAVRKGKAVVVVDGTEGPPFDRILKGTPIFSMDERRVAYAGYRGGTWQLVVDGLVRYSFPLVKEYTVQFTPSGTHLLCLASYEQDGRKLAVAVNGTLSREYVFPAASVLVPNGPTSFHTIAVNGELAPSDNGYDQIKNGQFVRLEMDARLVAGR